MYESDRIVRRERATFCRGLPPLLEKNINRRRLRPFTFEYRSFPKITDGTDKRTRGTRRAIYRVTTSTTTVKIRTVDF